MTVAQASHRPPGTFVARSAPHQTVTLVKEISAKVGVSKIYASGQSPAALNTAVAAEPTVRNLRQLSDVELVCCCQGQVPDEVAFTELMRRYQPHVDKLLYHFSLEFSDRADLSQEVWIRVYRYIPRLKQANRFKPWLRRITTNLFYDTLRKRKRFAGIISLDSSRRTDEGHFDWEVASDEPSPVDLMMTQEFY
ncbi:MAG: sigma factor, partial [Cyanobacteria bacterium P01_G01_bin.38]